MQCTDAGCGRSWNYGENFPLCITNPCPLRAYKDNLTASMQASMRKTTADVKTICLGKMKASTVSSIDAIRDEADEDDFVAYDMKGGMSATTKVKLPNQTVRSFKTKDNMHSEMCALDFMLENNYWVVMYGKVFKGNGQSIGTDEFVTTEPHCGFCTITLIILGLPLTRPTSGNHKMAVNNVYPIPKKLLKDPQFIIRFINSGSFEHHKLKQLLNPFVNKKPAEWLLKINDFLLVSDNSAVLISHVDEALLRNIHIYDLSKFLGDTDIVKSIWEFITSAMYSSNNSCSY